MCTSNISIGVCLMKHGMGKKIFLYKPLQCFSNQEISAKQQKFCLETNCIQNLQISEESTTTKFIC